MIRDEIKLCLKGGRQASKHKEYLRLYKELTGKDYPNQSCTGCAIKYLHRFLENYYERTK